MVEHNGLWIGGQLLDSDSPRRIRVESPSTEEIIGSVPDSTSVDADRAVGAARTAFDEGGWSRWTWEERAAVVRRARDILAPKADALSRLVTSENGIMSHLRSDAILPLASSRAAAIFSDCGSSRVLGPPMAKHASSERPTVIRLATAVRSPKVSPWL